MTDESQISEREREILRLVASGATNQQIAYQLNISVNTVKVHVRNIYGKIGVVSRSEATLYAVRAGLVSVEQVGPATAVADPPEEPPAESEPLASNGHAALVEPVAPATPAELVAPVAEPPAPEPAPEVVLPTVVPVPALAFVPSEAAPLATPAPRSPSPLVLGGAALTLLLVGGLIALLLLRSPAGNLPAPSVAPAAEPPANSERWRELAPLPAPRAGFALASASSNGKSYLYVIGGDGPDGVDNSVLRYDVASDRWVGFSAKPTPVADVQAAVVSNRMYVPGGRRADGTISDQLEAYDPQRDEWVTLAPLPGPRSRYALAAVEGKLYLFGGWDGTAFSDQVWQYNPDTDSWAELGRMPAPRADAGAATIEGQVYLLGGANEGGGVARNERYNPAEEGGGNPWTILAPLPEPRAAMAAAAASQYVFLLGGGGEARSYNSSQDNWEVADPPLDPALSGVRAATVGDKLYIFGGRDANGPSAKAYEYQALYTVVVPILRQ